MSTLFTWLFRLLFAFMGLVFLLFLMAALVVYIVWAGLRWLVTGRKPQVAVVWEQYSKMRKNFVNRGTATRSGQRFGDSGPSPFRRSSDDDVVDVEVRQVPDEPAALPGPNTQKQENKG